MVLLVPKQFKIVLLVRVRVVLILSKQKFQDGACSTKHMAVFKMVLKVPKQMGNFKIVLIVPKQMGNFRRVFIVPKQMKIELQK